MEQVRHHTPGRAAATPRPAATAPTVVATAAHVQLQGALRVSSPRDPAEREADATAERVMRMPAPSAAASALSQRSEAPSLARFAESAQAMRSRPASPIIARKGVGTARVTSGVAAEVANSKAAGAPLPASVQNFMAPRFGADFSAVRVHTGDRAAKLNQHLAAHAFTHGQHIFFGKDKWKPDTHEGKELLAHELTHTIQQGAVLQRSADVTVTEHADSSVVQLLGLGDVLDYFADKANAIPGFRMFTIVLGVNPINMAAVDRSAANILRAVVEFMPGGILLTKALDTYGVFEKAGAWIEGQLQSLGLSGASIKQSLMDFLNSLGLTDLLSPSSVWEKAKFHLTAPVEKTVRFVTALAGALLDLIKDAILRPLAALAADTPSWDLLCAVLGKNPITGDKVPRTAETLIGPFMKLIGQEEIWENIKKANAIARCYAWFQGALAGLMGFVQQIPGLFIDALKSLEIADIVVLPAALVKVGKAFAGFVARFTTWAGTTIWNLLEIVFAVVAPGVMPYVQKAAGAFRTILKNPGVFVGNLVNAGKLAFSQFRENFSTHLKKSLIDWLTGALKGAAIYIPRALSLAEVGKFVLSVVGVSWAKIRAKIVKALGPKGETMMKTAETTVDIIVALVKDGPAGAWEVIKDKLGNLKDMVIDAIIGFAKEKIVVAAITKLISMLNPAGAFVQAILAIYNTVMFFVERRAQIAAAVAAFIDSIAGVASGAFAAAARLIEKMMGATLTVVLSFLARLAGLGGVADKVVAKVKPLQAKVDEALDQSIAWIKEKVKALIEKLLGKGKKDERSEEEKKKDLEKAIAEAEPLASPGNEDAGAGTLSSKIAAIKSKYKLVALNLVRDGEDGFRFEAEINPKKRGGKHSAKKKRKPASPKPPKSPMSQAELEQAKAAKAARGQAQEEREKANEAKRQKAQQEREAAKAELKNIDQKLENTDRGRRGRGHGHEEHGYQTDLEDHKTRVETGKSPSGHRGRSGDPPTSSAKFNTPEAEWEALQKARAKVLEKAAALPDKMPDGQPARITVEVSTDRPRGFGTGYRAKTGPGGELIENTTGGYESELVKKIPKASATAEYLPSKDDWAFVSYYPLIK